MQPRGGNAPPVPMLPCRWRRKQLVLSIACYGSDSQTWSAVSAERLYHLRQYKYKVKSTKCRSAVSAERLHHLRQEPPILLLLPIKQEREYFITEHGQRILTQLLLPLSPLLLFQLRRIGTIRQTRSRAAEISVECMRIDKRIDKRNDKRGVHAYR